jgi:hypothetical protein
LLDRPLRRAVQQCIEVVVARHAERRRRRVGRVRAFPVCTSEYSQVLQLLATTFGLPRGAPSVQSNTTGNIARAQMWQG